MALKFTRIGDIPGHHGPIIRGAPEHRAREVAFYHLAGAAQIVGQPGPRTLLVRCCLYDGWTQERPEKLFDYLKKLDEGVGNFGTLEETGLIRQKFTDCLFEGYDPIPVPGQEEPGPLKDIGGTLFTDDPEQPDNGWFINVVLRFRQLRVGVRK